MTIALTLAALPMIHGRWLSERVWEKCMLAMGALRVMRVVMLLMWLLCVFSHAVGYVLM